MDTFSLFACQKGCNFFILSTRQVDGLAFGYDCFCSISVKNTFNILRSCTTYVIFLMLVFGSVPTLLFYIVLKLGEGGSHTFRQSIFCIVENGLLFSPPPPPPTHTHTHKLIIKDIVFLPTINSSHFLPVKFTNLSRNNIRSFSSQHLWWLWRVFQNYKSQRSECNDVYWQLEASYTPWAAAIRHGTE